MVLAQRLYESGKITYMRTDSVALSQDALTMAEAAITKNYGKKYVNIHQYKNKIASLRSLQRRPPASLCEAFRAGAGAMTINLDPCLLRDDNLQAT